MHIPPYQIHNVLKAYSRQLIQYGDYRKKGKTKAKDGIMISAGEKRQTVIDKIATIIVNKITNMNTEKADPKELAEMNDRSSTKRTQFKKTEFVYHVIDMGNEKTRHRLSVETGGSWTREKS